MNLRTLAVLLAVGLVGSHCWAQGEAQALMVKQRAKNIQTKNDENQKAIGSDGAAPAPVAPGAPSAPPTPAPPKLTPAQQSFLLLNFSMAAIKGGEAKPEQIDALNNALLANAHGTKPSPGAQKKLATALGAALAQKPLAPAQRGRVEQDIVTILNDTTMPLAQYNDVAADPASVFKKAGVDDKLGTAVTDALKAVAAEIRKK